MLVKPNLVMHENPTGNGTDCLYTHPSVIAAVIDYVVVALRGEGLIVLADAPMQSCDWNKLIDGSGLRELVEWYRAQGVDIELRDMRGLRSAYKEGVLTQELVDDAAGAVIDLGGDSAFSGLSQSRIDGLRITNYDPSELKRHHTENIHEYYVSRDLLDADVVINLPKAKTHRKAGVTGALKNMVGVNVRKEYLPHHSNGSAAEGFDEYEQRSLLKRVASSLLDRKNEKLASGGGFSYRALAFACRCLYFAGKRISGDFKSEGSWWGNDTIWRTVLDLNKIVLYADAEGVMHDTPQRRMLVVCDMVTIGQGEGPLLPEPGEWGMLSFCDDPVVHDIGMARLMGSDETVIPTIHNARCYDGKYALSDVRKGLPKCSSNSRHFDGVEVGDLNEDARYLAVPTSGWSPRFARKK